MPKVDFHTLFRWLVLPQVGDILPITDTLGEVRYAKVLAIHQGTDDIGYDLIGVSKEEGEAWVRDNASNS